MLSQNSANQETTLYGELIRHGLPTEYALRTAHELHDHRADLLAELRSANVPDVEAIVNERIGETRVLAKQIALDYRRRTWLGRWPLVGIAVASLPLLLVGWIVSFGLVYVSGLLVAEVGTACGFGRPSTMVQAVLAYSLLLYFFTAVPTAITFLWGRIALRTTNNRMYPLAICLMIALIAGSCWTDFKVSETPGEGQLAITSPLTALVLNQWMDQAAHPYIAFSYFGAREALQLLGPMVVGGWLILIETRRRRHALGLDPLDTGYRNSA